VRDGALGPCRTQAAPRTYDERTLAFSLGRDGYRVMSDDGLVHFAGGKVVHRHPMASLPFDRATVIHRDARGRVWVGSTRGLFLDREGRLVPFRGPDGPIVSPIRSIFESAQGRVWILGETTLWRIDGDGPVTARELSGPARTGIAQVIEDRDGSVWIGSEAGLTRYRDDRFITYGTRDGLPGAAVSAVFEDREGSLWVGTQNGSIAQFTDRTLPTRRGPPSLRGGSVESVCEGEDGAMWFGSFRGLTRWKDGQERTYTRADGLPHERVYATYPGLDGELWVGTGAGLARWRDGRIDVPHPSFKAGVFSLYRDRAGTLWIGTNEGLARLVGGRIVEVPGTDGFRARQVRGMQEDDEGILWVTSVGGLARVDGGRLLHVPHLRPEVGAADRGISRDSDGALWFGAGTTLVRRSRGAFRTFASAEGLPRDWLFQVLADELGYLWIATSRTIMRGKRQEFDEVARGKRQRVAMMTFDTTDERGEIAARRSRTPGAWKSRDGRLWFATLAGVVTVDPRRVRTNPLPPTVIIEKAMVDGRPALRGAANEFPPGAGNLEFHFAGLTLVEPQKALHRYRLEGFDDGWVEAGARRLAYYANIPPGRYRFEVQASNADGVWSQAGAALELRLAPHYYQTVWFYALCACGVLGVAFSLYRARLLHLRAQYLAVFAERSRVARELHDSLLQGMSAVALELENVRAELPPDATSAARRLGAVEDALTASLAETRRFVWNLREQPTGTGELGLALERLAGRLTEGRGVECQVSVEGKVVHLSHDAQGSLFRIAQEALVNALKHGDARRIEVRLTYQDGTVKLTVRDDGRGFDPAQAEGAEAGHFGLLGMRERARKLGATLEVDSAPGAGTTTTVILPAVRKRSTDIDV
jgi:signal transduction histidine kinase/ligand-binding sensor domain-containing protein